MIFTNKKGKSFTLLEIEQLAKNENLTIERIPEKCPLIILLREKNRGECAHEFKKED